MSPKEWWREEWKINRAVVEGRERRIKSFLKWRVKSGPGAWPRRTDDERETHLSVSDWTSSSTQDPQCTSPMEGRDPQPHRGTDPQPNGGQRTTAPQRAHIPQGGEEATPLKQAHIPRVGSDPHP